MPKDIFPRTPKDAFDNAEAMAKKLKISLIRFCALADVSPSPVYRWQTNLRTYDVSLYGKLHDYFEARNRRKPKK